VALVHCVVKKRSHVYLRTVRVRVRVQLYTYSVQLYTALYNVYSYVYEGILSSYSCKLLTLHSKRTLTTTTYLRIFIFIVHVRVRVQYKYHTFTSEVRKYFRTQVRKYFRKYKSYESTCTTTVRCTCTRVLCALPEIFIFPYTYV
jgi:hypothetical protein